MEKFINDLLAQEKSLETVTEVFSEFARSNDYNVYSAFTDIDLNIRDEFESYISLSNSIDDLIKKWDNR